LKIKLLCFPRCVSS